MKHTDVDERHNAARHAAIVEPSSGFADAELASNTGIIAFSSILFVTVLGVALGVSCLLLDGLSLVGIFVGLALAALAVACVRVADEWEKVVVLRLGKFNRVVGPGLFFVIPVVESVAMRVDTRVRVTTFGAEETLTSDLVPLDVDAALFWVVFDAKAACTEVGDFSRAVEVSAQTALRDAIGRGGVAEVALRREQLDRELKTALSEKVGLWGVSVLSVEVRDIVLPKDLQDAMSQEAKADQQRKARIILMEGEQDIAEMMDEVAESYADNETALRLRQMHLLYESVRDTGGTVVIPSGMGDVFSSLSGESSG